MVVVLSEIHLPVAPQTSNSAYSVLCYDWEREGSDGEGLHQLLDACLVSLSNDIRYIWVFDKCVSLQDHNEVVWHYERIHMIFREARLCIVVPGRSNPSCSLNICSGYMDRMNALLEAMWASIDRIVLIHNWGQQGEGDWVLQDLPLQLLSSWCVALFVLQGQFTYTLQCNTHRNADV